MHICYVITNMHECIVYIYKKLSSAIIDITETKMDEAVQGDILKEFHGAYLKENPQNPIMKPSLR